jgi:predicted enzyme involved in methoxymalonyl-ACP biosynthesis
VEHAVLAFLLNRHLAETNRDFHANYRKTAKNAPGGKVFEEVGFEQVAERDGVLSLTFKRGREVPDDRIVEIKKCVDETCKAPI